jgi:hypothetical protein
MLIRIVYFCIDIPFTVNKSSLRSEGGVRVLMGIKGGFDGLIKRKSKVEKMIHIISLNYENPGSGNKFYSEFLSRFSLSIEHFKGLVEE